MNGDEKLCKKCGLPKQKTEFYRHVHTFDRLKAECKACWNLAVNNRRKANIENYLASRRKYIKRRYVQRMRNDYERVRRARKRSAARTKDGSSQ